MQFGRRRTTGHSSFLLILDRVRSARHRHSFPDDIIVSFTGPCPLTVSRDRRLRTGPSTTRSTPPLMANPPANGIHHPTSRPEPSVVRSLFPSALRSPQGNKEKIAALPEQAQELTVDDPEAVSHPLGPFARLSSNGEPGDDKHTGGGVAIPPRPDDFSHKYLYPTLAKSERDRLTMVWYYTRDIQNVSPPRIAYPRFSLKPTMYL
jgi:hypothetical protein